MPFQKKTHQPVFFQPGNVQRFVMSIFLGTSGSTHGGALSSACLTFSGMEFFHFAGAWWKTDFLVRTSPCIPSRAFHPGFSRPSSFPYRGRQRLFASPLRGLLSTVDKKTSKPYRGLDKLENTYMCMDVFLYDIVLDIFFYNYIAV